MYKGSFLQTRLPKALNLSIDQKIRPSICFEICAEPLKGSAELLKHSTTCLCYNTAHAVPISHGRKCLISWGCNKSAKLHKYKVHLGIFSAKTPWNVVSSCETRVLSTKVEAWQKADGEYNKRLISIMQYIYKNKWYNRI